MDEFRSCDDIQRRSKYTHERTIIHFDLDCFYAQVEILKNPQLSTKPVGIKQQHYVITCNYVAREFGVTKCMLITEALSLCPKLVIINGEDLHDYRLMSSKVTDLIKQFSSKVEKLGFDENFVDVSDLVSTKLNWKDCDQQKVIGHVYKNEIEYTCTCGCKERLSIGSQIAAEIREKIKDNLGLTTCAGIGHNKLLAKLVGPTHKPNQQTTIFPCSAISLIFNLKSVGGIPGIGRKTCDVLDALGISSIGDIQNCSEELLQKHVGKSLAHWIKGACFGIDDHDVKESGKQQVIGLEEASKQISSLQDINDRLISLIDRGMILLQEDGRFPTTLRVSVRKYSSHEEYARQRESKQCSINPSIFRMPTAKEQILQMSLNLFKKLVDVTQHFHLTLLGLAFAKFQEELPPKNSLLTFFEKKDSNTCTLPSEPSTNFCNSTIDDTCFQDPVASSSKGVLNNVASSPDTTCLNGLDESVLNELPYNIRCEVLENYSLFNRNMPSSASKPESHVECPLGIEKTVFNELPYEIQMELLRDFNKQSGIVGAQSTSAKKQISILNYINR